MTSLLHSYENKYFKEMHAHPPPGFPMFGCASKDLQWGCTAVHFSMASISWTHVGGGHWRGVGGGTLVLLQRVNLRSKIFLISDH